jgi:hypothetical protein
MQYRKTYQKLNFYTSFIWALKIMRASFARETRRVSRAKLFARVAQTRDFLESRGARKSGENPVTSQFEK